MENHVLALIKIQRNAILASVQNGRVGVTIQFVLKNVDLEFRPGLVNAKYIKMIMIVLEKMKKQDHAKDIIVLSVSLTCIILTFLYAILNILNMQ